MTGFEPGSCGIGIDRAINCATTTAQSAAYSYCEGFQIGEYFCFYNWSFPASTSLY